MLMLLRKLAYDTVGSSISTEMSLVTSVTVGALIMSMGNFAGGVNARFKSVSDSNAFQVSDLEKEKKAEEAARKAEFELKKQEAKRQRDERAKAQATQELSE